MALFVCIARQVPEAIAVEREKLLAEMGRLTMKHETATSAATSDTRAMFQAHQKHLEQNMVTWQNKEQHAIQALDRIATRFEESAKYAAAKLQRVCIEFQSATKEHQAAALKAQQWVDRVSLENRVWPYVACCAVGAIVTIAVRYFLERSSG